MAAEKRAGTRCEGITSSMMVVFTMIQRRCSQYDSITKVWTMSGVQ